MRKERKPCERRISEHGKAQCAGAAQPITNAPEESSAQCPAQKESPLNNRAVMPHLRVSGSKAAEQLGDEGRRHQRVQVHVQPVECPPQPRRNSRPPLMFRELTK